MKRLEKDILTLFVFTGLLFLTWAQTKAPPFFLIPDEGKVYLILASPPKEMAGFNLYRQKRGEKDFTLLTPEPITPISEPFLARDILGEEEYQWLSNALKAEDEFSLLRRLKDPGVGGALSLVSRKVALVLGKIYIDSMVNTGEEYTYRIAFLNYKGEEFFKGEEKVLVQKHLPPDKRVEKITFTVGKDHLKLNWEYPRWQGDKKDLVVGFNIYKKSETEEDFKKVLPFPYLRTGEKLFYIDKNVSEGKTYQYYLVPVDLVGAEGLKSEIITVELKDITPPAPPPVVNATPEEGAILLEWEPSPDEDVIGYNVYRSWSIHGEFRKINPKPIPKEERRFVDRDVSATGMLYVYRVASIDEAGLEGRQSTAAFGMPKDTTPPPPVSNLQARVEKHFVELNWKPQLTPDLDGYYVYRAEEKDKPFRLVGPPIKKEITSFIDSGFVKKGLYPGHTYYYYVSQVDIALNEGERTLIEVKIPDDEPPSPPPSIYCKNNDDGTVEVTWQVSLTPDLAKYRVYRQEEGKDALMVKELPPDVNNYSDKEVAKGKRYLYLVSAVDSAGNESEKKVFEIIPRDISPPPPVKGLKVSYKEGRVLLTWEEVVVDDLLGYNVYRANLPTGIPERLNKDILRENKFSDPTGNENYYYWVTVFDTSGNESERSQVLRPER
jgi:fibronectin type 3 domain-containing protein